MFGLDPPRVGQLRRALKRLAQPGRQWVSFTFLTKDEVACLAKLAERQPFRAARPDRPALVPRVAHLDTQRES